MTVNEMVDYLKKDLKKSVENDVSPCLQTEKREGGYFVIPRLVLSYVDYLGALHHGYSGSHKPKGRRIFADHTYAKSFIRDFFGPLFANYRTFGDLLWEIYRNGTIHLYEPLTLENSDVIISWQIFKGRSGERTILGDPTQSGRLIPLTHVLPWPIVSPTKGESHPNEWILPISTTCLHDDLLSAIDGFADFIQADSDAQRRFASTMEALVIPEKTCLKWW